MSETSPDVVDLVQLLAALQPEAEAPVAAEEQALCQCVHHLLPTVKAEYATLLRRY